MTTQAVEAKPAFVPPVNEVWKNVKRGAFDASVVALGTVGVLDVFANAVSDRLPRLVRVEGITPEFTNKFLNLTREHMVPEGVMGHFTHLDHVVVSHLCQNLLDLAEQNGLRDNLNRFAITLALSVRNGKQSAFMQRMYPKMEAYVNARGLDFITFTREKDVKVFGMVKGKSSELRGLANRLNQPGAGIIVPAGGSVQPGRHPEGAKEDEVFGLQRIDVTKDKDDIDPSKGNGILKIFDKMQLRYRTLGQRPYILPISINRTWRVFCSDSLLPTPEGLISLSNRASELLIPRGFERMEIIIVVGDPIREEDFVSKLGTDWKKHPQEATDLIMIEVARNLRRAEARGYYGQFIKEESAAA